MNLRFLLPCIAVSVLGFTPLTQAHADTFSTSGTFTADNSVYTRSFTTTSAQTYTFATTSYATGGFDPVLTLFSSDGNPIDNSGPGISDAMLTDTLASGSYVLYLTEFPNVAIGKLSDGFLFANDPTATGDAIGVPGGMFLDAITGAQRTNGYTLTGNSSPATAVTPEPSTWLLVLSGMAGLSYAVRRRQTA